MNNPYRCPKKATYEDDDLDEDDTPDFDVPDYTPHQRITPDSQEWFQDILDTFKEDSDLCAGEEYKEAGELVGSAFVARDVKAFAEALGEDGLIRYEGELRCLQAQDQRAKPLSQVGHMAHYWVPRLQPCSPTRWIEWSSTATSIQLTIGSECKCFFLHKLTVF